MASACRSGGSDGPGVGGTFGWTESGSRVGVGLRCDWLIGGGIDLIEDKKDFDLLLLLLSVLMGYCRWGVNDYQEN